MDCKYCGKPLPAGSRERREYCSNAHRQAHYRQQHQNDQAAAGATELAAAHTELEHLRGIIQEQTNIITHLQTQLDFERRFLDDRAAHHFKQWLRKQPASPAREKFLADPSVPPRGSHALYKAHARRLDFTPDEHDDFTRLWKLLLLQT